MKEGTRITSSSACAHAYKQKHSSKNASEDSTQSPGKIDPYTYMDFLSAGCGLCAPSNPLIIYKLLFKLRPDWGITNQISQEPWWPQTLVMKLDISSLQRRLGRSCLRIAVETWPCKCTSGSQFAAMIPSIRWKTIETLGDLHFLRQQSICSFLM